MFGSLIVDNIGELVTCRRRRRAAARHRARRGGGRAQRARRLRRRARRAAGATSAATTSSTPAARLVTPGPRRSAHAPDLRRLARARVRSARPGQVATSRSSRRAAASCRRCGRPAPPPTTSSSPARAARLDRFLAQGVTVVEAKSGYDLTIEGELRLLGALLQAVRAVARRRRLADAAGARAAARAATARALRARLCRRADPARAQLPRRSTSTATTAPSRSTRRAPSSRRRKTHGLRLRVHAEQFTHTGAAELAAELGARSRRAPRAALRRRAGEAGRAPASSATCCPARR